MKYVHKPSLHACMYKNYHTYMPVVSGENKRASLRKASPLTMSLPRYLDRLGQPAAACVMNDYPMTEPCIHGLLLLKSTVAVLRVCNVIPIERVPMAVVGGCFLMTLSAPTWTLKTFDWTLSFLIDSLGASLTLRTCFISRIVINIRSVYFSDDADWSHTLRKVTLGFTHLRLLAANQPKLVNLLTNQTLASHRWFWFWPT